MRQRGSGLLSAGASFLSQALGLDRRSEGSALAYHYVWGVDAAVSFDFSLAPKILRVEISHAEGVRESQRFDLKNESARGRCAYYLIFPVLAVNERFILTDFCDLKLPRHLKEVWRG